MEYTTELRIVEAENVSKAWKAFHVLFLFLASIFGIISGFILALIFEDKFFLCGTPTGVIIQDGKNSSFNISIEVSVGTAYDCQYSLYTMITSSIFGTIWAVFFIMCGRGGKSVHGLPQPWRIVMPALIFSAITFIITIASSAVLSVSQSSFCSSFGEELRLLTNGTENKECDRLEIFIKFNFDIKAEDMILIAEVTSWLCSSAWGLSTLLCCLRILLGPDFRIITLRVPKAEKDMSRPSSSLRSSIISKFSTARNVLLERKAESPSNDNADKRERPLTENMSSPIYGRKDGIEASSHDKDHNHEKLPDTSMEGSVEVHKPPFSICNIANRKRRPMGIPFDTLEQAIEENSTEESEASDNEPEPLKKIDHMPDMEVIETA